MALQRCTGAVKNQIAENVKVYFIFIYINIYINITIIWGLGGQEIELQRCNDATLTMKILYILHHKLMPLTEGSGNSDFTGLKVWVCRLESRSPKAWDSRD